MPFDHILRRINLYRIKTALVETDPKWLTIKAELYFLYNTFCGQTLRGILFHFALEKRGFVGVCNNLL